tara:strand:+ start:160 stop:999 length:840 start_codon:yes stop_codon:yes gene_type:complete
MQTTLVTADWLKAQPLEEVMIFDATYFLPTMGRDGRKEYKKAHIPGAIFFDIDSIKDENSELPHMIPSAKRFQNEMQNLGLNAGQQVVAYDNSLFLSSARAWWMLRFFGHYAVAVLDGGLSSWKAAGGALTDEFYDLPKGTFQAGASAKADIIKFDELEQAVRAGLADQIVDARAADRFAGSAPEPRPGLRAGHIPNSLNLPIGDILDQTTGKLKPAGELSKLFAKAGLLMDQPVITTCGSGVTAAGLTLALAVLGKTDIRLYDGSWSEWGASDAPIET